MDIKVALISEEFPPYTFGGVGSFCYDLALKLSQKEIPTIVLSGKASNITIEKINDYLKIMRLPCFNFPPAHFWFQIRNFNIPLKIFKGYSVLHCIAPDISLMGLYLKRKLKKPMVTSLHGLPSSDLRVFLNSPLLTWSFGEFGYNLLEYPLNELFFKKALTKSDHVMTCSYATLTEIKQAYPNIHHNKISVIYNAINFDKFYNVKFTSPHKERNDHFMLVFYGRLYWRKGITYLLYAVKKLIKDFPKLQLQIFGRGPMEPLLKKLITKLNLSGIVSLRGYVKYSELLKIIKMADVITLPSLYEAQSIAMLEAMALKKPIVAFDFPFSREIISDMHNGLLAKPADVEDLSNKIRLLLADEKLRTKLGQNAYEYVKKRHNWNTLVEKYIQLYKNIT